MADMLITRNEDRGARQTRVVRTVSLWAAAAAATVALVVVFDLPLLSVAFIGGAAGLIIDVWRHDSSDSSLSTARIVCLLSLAILAVVMLASVGLLPSWLAWLSLVSVVIVWAEFGAARVRAGRERSRTEMLVAGG